jgi:hypothetical protein
LQVGVSR